MMYHIIKVKDNLESELKEYRKTTNQEIKQDAKKPKSTKASPGKIDKQSENQDILQHQTQQVEDLIGNNLSQDQHIEPSQQIKPASKRSFSQA